MKTRKIAALGSFIAGAAIACAPIASADDYLTSTIDSEIASLNSLFESQAALAGVGGDVITSPGLLDTIPLADAPITSPLTALDYELYGPLADFHLADLDPAPGAQDLFNGALVEFDDTYNTLASWLFSSDAVINPADLIGAADAALDDGSLTDAALFGTFLNDGIADVFSWFTSVPIG